MPVVNLRGPAEPCLGVAAKRTETGVRSCINDQSTPHSLSYFHTEESKYAILCLALGVNCAIHNFALSVLLVQVGRQMNEQTMPSHKTSAGLGGDLEYCGNTEEGLPGWGWGEGGSWEGF